jgi:hypothetical protein
LTPRKPEPEPEKPKVEQQNAEPAQPDPFAFLTPTQTPTEPVTGSADEWRGEATQAMPVPSHDQQRPQQPQPQQQFRPPSQYPQDVPTVPAWQLPPSQRQAQQQPPAAAVPATAPWQQAAPVSAMPPVAPPTVAPPVAPTPVPDAAASAPTEAVDSHDIDDIFGDHAFREYDDGPLIGQIPRPAIGRAQQAAQPATRKQVRSASSSSFTTTHKVLVGVAAALIGALALVALYLAGTKVSASGEPEQQPVAATTLTQTPTPSESVAVAAVGPVAPGTYAWDELLSSECLEPFTNAWEQEYTVVDCETPHTGQLTTRGTFEGEAFPGVDTLASQINLLCASTKVINYKKAAAYDDIAITASYSTTEAEWNAGLHDYYCFVSRTSGDLITGTIARKPQPIEG